MPANKSINGKLRVFVIGCGSIGQRHIANLKKLGVKEIIAFDLQSKQRCIVAEKFGIKTASTIADGWKESPNVALIAAPSNLHIPLALEAARRSCHLFVEKPLSHTLRNITKLVYIVKKRRLTTMVGCNMRFHPGPAAVKRLLNEQAIGNIMAARIQTSSYLPHWRPGQDYHKSYSASVEYGGAILDCIHEIDLALWYLGPAKFLAAASLPAKSIGLKTDGLAEIILRHKSGALCNVHLNFVQRDYRRTCQLIGTEGTIYWDFADRCVQVFDADGELAQTISEPKRWAINQMYIDELSHFLAAVLSNSQTINPLSGGLDALIIASAARAQGDKRLHE